MTDLVASTPSLLLLLFVRALLPLNVQPATSVTITFFLLGAVGWTSGVRVFAAAAASASRSDYIRQARALGCPTLRIAFVQIAAALRPVAAAQFWTLIPLFLLAEANLGMLGLGVSEPLPSIGNLLAETQLSPQLWQQPAALAPAALLVSGFGELARTAHEGTRMIKSFLSPYPVLLLFAPMHYPSKRTGGLEPQLKLCAPQRSENVRSAARREEVGGDDPIPDGWGSYSIQPGDAETRGRTGGKLEAEQRWPAANVRAAAGTPIFRWHSIFGSGRGGNTPPHDGSGCPFADGRFLPSGGRTPAIVVERSNQVAIEFPAPVAGVERLFDQIAIIPFKLRRKNSLFSDPSRYRVCSWRSHRAEAKSELLAP